MTLLVLLAVLSGPPPLPPDRPPVPEAPTPAPVYNPNRDRAQALYAEGSTLYDSADYAGAIAKFTEALALVQDTGEQDERSRLVLLWNIASAHEKAYAVDHDVTHLRQALLLYQRYLGFAERTGDSAEQQDAKKRIANLEKAITEKDLSKKEILTTPSPFGPSPDKNTWKQPRNIGIGLLVPGVAGLVSGAVLIGVGSTFEDRARAQVNKLADVGVPADDPAWDQGAKFIEQERQKGRILMGVGGAALGVGALFTGFGTFYLVKANRTRMALSVTPAVRATYFGLSFSGRF